MLGIDNVNEFYSEHYLDAVVSDDLRALFSRWTKTDESGGESPDRRLRALKKRFLEVQRAHDSDRAELTSAQRSHALRAFHTELLAALGYPTDPPADGEDVVEVEDGVIPLRSRFTRNGVLHLAVLEAGFVVGDDASILQSTLLRPESGVLSDGDVLLEDPIEDVVSLAFALASPPVWVLVLGGPQVLLAERSRWGQGRYLRFHLDDLFDLTDAASTRAFAALLACEALVPTEGETPLHDVLDEASHKHAFGVSQALKYGLREAVELLGNAWIRRRREQKKLGLDTGGDSLFDDKTASALTVECLTFLYRLLFLFYAEARGKDLGVVPMDSEAYRLGYSLEHLRDLELVLLHGVEAREGTFIHDSLERLFALLNQGWKNTSPEFESSQHTFEIPALRSKLFDTKATPLLSNIRIDNDTMQNVLSLLSLSREERARGRRRPQRGRISYSRLGINQLGAVYEGLLSYTGFFANEDLYELKSAAQDSDADAMEQVFFARKSDVEEGKFTDDEFVLVPPDDPDGPLQRKKYLKGSFVYRLAGRDRERSASYYTPEVLTRCVVKYALKELLKDIVEAPESVETAHRIVELTVCEPAMGSGAFLNEAINQLADAYLARRQKELKTTLSPDEVAHEVRRVRARIATQNCYGVDLNPIAAELAKVSLWLNILGPNVPVPWLDLRLAEGNSLFGCRRQVFRAADLLMKDNKKGERSWLGLIPETIPLGTPLPADGVLHFLVADEGMAAAGTHKVAKEMEPKACEAMRAWLKNQQKPFSKAETNRLVELSEKADALWTRHVELRKRAVARTTARVHIWGEIESADRIPPLEDCERARDELMHPTSPLRRLRMAMDLWCALWVWPIDEAAKLPSRSEWLALVGDLLEGKDVVPSVPTQVGLDFDAPLPVGPSIGVSPRARARQRGLDLPGAFESKQGQREMSLAPAASKTETEAERARSLGVVDVDALFVKHVCLAVAAGVARRQRFFHWDLTFADLFAERGGFDLVVGNPPWLKVEWNESGILSEFEPVLGVRPRSATELEAQRTTFLTSHTRTTEYLQELDVTHGVKSYLGSIQAYPLLEGVPSNLYKCFLTRGWELGGPRGVVALVHQEGLYDDARGWALREALYSRLSYRFEFANQLRLFNEIMNTKHFGIVVSASRPKHEIHFSSISGLYHPSTIDKSFDHHGRGAVPPPRAVDGGWELNGHQGRIVDVDIKRLTVFAQLYDEPGTPPERARLPNVHSAEMMQILERFSATPKLADLDGGWFATEMWNETGRQKDGTISATEKQCLRPRDLILSGPHLYVAKPFNKSPNVGCRNPKDYTSIDLTLIGDDYLPRTLYSPLAPDYDQRGPTFDGKPVAEYFRHAQRAMLSITGERTLIGALIPPGTAHIHGVVSFCFSSPKLCVLFSAVCSSILVDYLVRSTGKANMHGQEASHLPFPVGTAYESELLARALRLNCLSSHYSALWKELWTPGTVDGFTKTDRRLAWDSLDSSWKRASPLRTPYERRQALVEIDALTALALGISADELCAVYVSGFPLLRINEAETWYDQRGNIAFTSYSGLSATGLSRAEFEPIRDATRADRLPREIRERGFIPPFDTCDRETDMRLAFGVFASRLDSRQRGAA